MRIAISGTANSGKSTLVRRILNTWPNYISPTTSYRDILKENNLNHSEQTNEATQELILDFMIKQLNEYKDIQHIVYDRCPLDVLVYSVAASEQNLVSDDFVTDIIIKVKESLSLLDMIVILPYNESIKIEDNGTRNTNVEYIKKIDNIFQNLLTQYYTDFEANVFFPVENCPGIIPLEDPSQYIQLLKGIINEKGDLYSADSDIEVQKQLAEAIEIDKKSEELLKSLIGRQESLLPKIDISKLKL